MEKTALTTLVLDREQLEKNLFWRALVKRIKEQQKSTRELLESEISASLEKIRFYQGQLAMYQLFFDLPDLILSDVSKEEEVSG